MLAEKPRILRCRRLWTGTTYGCVDHSCVTISGDVISGIRHGVEGRLPFAMPSFVDAHCHLFWMGFAELNLDLSACRNACDLLSAVGTRDIAEDSVIRGERWDESSWADPSLPTQEEIDSASSGRPVFLRRVCGHAAIVSSATLELLEDAGTFGYLEGPVIREEPVLRFDEFLPPSRQRLLEAFELAREQAFSEGVTALRTLDPRRNCSALAAMDDPGIWVSMAVWAENRELPQPLAASSRKARLWGVKAFLDGGIGAGTAAMGCPFSAGPSGTLLYSDDELSRLLSTAFEAGLPVAAHAIGGKALNQLDEVCSNLIAHGNPGKARVTVEHAEELQAEWPGKWDRTLHMFSMQPNFVRRWQGEGGMYDIRLGRSNALGLNPFSLPLEHGFELGFGSDGMPFGPLWGIPGAIHHPAGLGLDLEEAFRAYTTGAAAVSGFTELAQPIGAGRPAHLTVLSADPFEAGLDGLEILATICDGKVVWGDPGVLEDA